MRWCGSSKNRKISSSSIFTLIFPILGENKNGAKDILKVLEYIAKILKVLKAWN